MDNLVLGIDPGTATTGYGLVLESEGCLHLKDFGVIITPGDCPLPERLKKIYHELLELARRYQPAAAAVEALFFSRNARTALAVGQARGVVLLALAEAGLPVYEYTPLQVKQAIVGYGRASKGQMQQMVRMLLSLEEIPQPDDAADAVALAICHIHSVRMKTLLES